MSTPPPFNSIPQIQVALNGWEYPIQFLKITQTNVDFQTVNTSEVINFQGVVQPLDAQKLAIKPIGERSWQWYEVHCRTSINVKTNDQIIYNGENYKVMGQDPWVLNNYYRYELVKNYEG